GRERAGEAHCRTCTGREAVVEAPEAVSVTTTKIRPRPGRSPASTPVAVPPVNRSLLETRLPPTMSRAIAEHAPHPAPVAVPRTRPAVTATATASDAMRSGGVAEVPAAYRIPPSRNDRNSGSE